MRIQTGETIAIGGLVKEASARIENKVPILGDIPGLGLLFRNTKRHTSDPTRQDLLIFLTVKLMDDTHAVAQTAALAPSGSLSH